MATNIIQVVENSDRFHACVNNVPCSTHLFGNGISKAFAEMQAHASAYKLALYYSQLTGKLKFKQQETK